jgi:hypothetical protein
MAGVFKAPKGGGLAAQGAAEEAALPAGYRELRSLGAEANRTGGLPAGYRRVVAENGDVDILGPRGGVYRATDRYDIYGNPVFKSENNGYFVFTSTAAEHVPATTGTFQYNTLNPGPLASLRNAPSQNFYGGNYNAATLTEDIILYRAGTDGSPYGQWFTRIPPESVANVRIDLAVKPQWIDPVTQSLQGTSPIDTVFALRIPRGTTIYEGPVASQGGVYLGGRDQYQIFIPGARDIRGVEVLSAHPIR